jgi:hypothetical protein
VPKNTFQNLLALSLGLLLLASACKSENKAAPEAQQPAEQVVDTNVPATTAATTEPETGPDDSHYLSDPFFYKVSGPEGASGYILGSMHMGVDANKELPPQVWEALRGASVLVIEADITDLSMSSGLMLPKGQNLRQLLGEEDWKLLEETLGASTAKMMATMKPAAVAASIGAKGLPITMPMELSLIMKAQESKVEIDYLETALFQLDLLNKIMDIDFLKHMLRTAKEEDTKKLLELYRKGDEDALHEAVMQPDAWGQDFETNVEAMLFARNDDWVPKLEQLFQRKDVFVAVGAAHLVGPRGVLASLRKKGYTIERQLTKP